MDGDLIENVEGFPQIHEHSQTPIADVIAEQKLIALTADKRWEVTLQIGRPYVDEDNVARCPVAAWGIDGRYPDLVGGGTLNALNMACSFLERRLLDTVRAGHMRFRLPGENEGELSLAFITMTLFGRIMVKHPRQIESEASNTNNSNHGSKPNN